MEANYYNKPPGSGCQEIGESDPCYKKIINSGGRPEFWSRCRKSEILIYTYIGRVDLQYKKVISFDSADYR